MNYRFIGGILLIVGTSIGAGMLALPVANVSAGFWPSSLLLLLCWALMTAGAFYILEVSLCMPRGSHMVSMAYHTLGRPGLIIAWLSYLFLLYTLLSAYISGGADVLSALLSYVHIYLQSWQASLIFTLVFGLIVYGGIVYVDYVNRLLMFAKLVVYGLLVLCIAPYIQSTDLLHSNFQALGPALMIVFTSFGFAIIVPNLRDYFQDDVKTLKRVVLIGSLIPLFCYLAWDAVIIGSLPSYGPNSLASLRYDPHTTSRLAVMLSLTVNNRLISSFFHFFTSVCMLTAFLGVSLCLNSFLADGLKMQQSGKEGRSLFALTFFPSLMIVIFYPGAYIYALSYAGLFCVILLLLLPALMSYFGRKKLSPAFIVPGGAIAQISLFLISIIILIYCLVSGNF
jgi:tyrosine-specific transport protein